MIFGKVVVGGWEYKKKNLHQKQGNQWKSSDLKNFQRRNAISTTIYKHED